MPKKKNRESPDIQSERFKKDAQKMIDAGELNPTVADETLDEMVRRSIRQHGA